MSENSHTFSSIGLLVIVGETNISLIIVLCLHNGSSYKEKCQCVTGPVSRNSETSAALLQKYLQIAQANHTTCSHLPYPLLILQVCRTKL